MKKLIYLLIVILTAHSCFSQTPAKKTGFTQFFSNNQYNRVWSDSMSNIAARDTVIAPIGIGETRFRTTDSTVYICISTSASQKWMKLKGYVPIGVGTGTVTSVGLSIDGSAILESNTPVTSNGTIALTWQGAATDVVLGNGSYTPFSAAITGVTDALYSPLGHTQPFSTITDGQTAVRALFSATAPLNYNSSTGNFSISGSTVQDGLISGGVVTWSGTGLIFDITAAAYVLGGSQYSSITSQVTLDVADGSYGRWDAIIVTNSGTVSKITGTPAASPVLPQTDPAAEILLTYVFIDAGATTPTQVSNEVIYDENIEWTHTTSGSVTANFASTTFAQQGTKSISTTWTASSNLIFTNGSTLSSGNYTTVSFYVRLSGNLANNTNISLQFYNSTNAVSNSVAAPIAKTTTGTWQLISFNVSQFSFTSTQFNSIRLILTGSTVGTLGTTTVYFDNIRLQAGVTPPQTVQGLQSAYTKISDGITVAAAAGSDQIKFRSADNKLTIAVGSNDATHGDNVLFTVNQANLSLSSIGGSLNVSQINASGGATGKVLSYDGTWVTNGGSAPDLQAVTDEGFSTTNPIFSTAAIVSESQFQARADAGFRVVNAGTFSSRAQIGMTSDNGFLALTNTGGFTGTLKADNLTGNYTYQFPNQAGTVLIGATPTTSSDNTVTHKVKINIGGTDYYIMATTSGL